MTNATTIEQERTKLSAILTRRSMLRRADALVSRQAAERKVEREAAEQVKRGPADSAAKHKLAVALAVARRRDELTRALDYPMTGAEVHEACTAACISAKLTADDLAEVSQQLASYVIRRFGPEPPRVKLSASWLRVHAVRIAQRQADTRERVTGFRAAADELAQWKNTAHRTAMSEAASAGGDAVYALAANRPELVAKWGADQADAEKIAKRLSGCLTYLQADAVRIAVSEVRKDAVPGKVRVAFHAACAILRKRFHSPEAVAWALRGESHAAAKLHEAAVRAIGGTLAEDHVGARGVSCAPPLRSGTAGGQRAEVPETAEEARKRCEVSLWAASSRDLVRYLNRDGQPDERRPRHEPMPDDGLLPPAAPRMPDPSRGQVAGCLAPVTKDLRCGSREATWQRMSGATCQWPRKKS